MFKKPWVGGGRTTRGNTNAIAGSLEDIEEAIVLAEELDEVLQKLSISLAALQPLMSSGRVPQETTTPTPSTTS